jgi:ubiquitin-protein ligase
MAAHNLAAAKRLRKELQHLERQGRAGEQDDVYLRPSNAEESILRWTALLRGPKETPFEGGVFQLSIKCGPDYPLAPPTITFVTKVSLFKDLCFSLHGSKTLQEEPVSLPLETICQSILLPLPLPSSLL